MDADAYPNRPIHECSLNLTRPSQRLRRTSKHNEKCISLGPDLNTTISRNRAPDPRAMQLQLRAIALAAELP